jgi:CheY-like chemotaxis protein
MTEVKAQKTGEKRISNILLVEDREEDVFFFRRALQKAGLPHAVTHVSDGDEAIKYLSSQPPYDDRAHYPLPDVVVLDLKMPGRDGFEVLQWLRDQKILKPAPVVVLTSSQRDADRQRTQELGADDYFIKPVSFPELVEVARDINSRWIERNE